MKSIITLSLIATMALFASCGNETSEQAETTNNINNNMSLKETLDAKREAFNANADEEKRIIYEEGIEQVAQSGILKSAMQVGDKAPDFVLYNAIGEEVKLSEYLKKGPIVLTWYRGGWCPYCNITLNKLQQEMPKFDALGAKLLALTPEIPDSSISTKEKNELAFEVMSDIGNEVARKYGVVYSLHEVVADYYQNGFDLHKYNGDESDELPLSATYVIAQDGMIKYAFLDADYRKRAEPADLLKVLEELK